MRHPTARLPLLLCLMALALPAAAQTPAPPPAGGPLVAGGGGGSPAPTPPARIERTVRVGEPFDIRLESNASTGYVWVLEETASSGLKALTPAGERYESPGIAPGAPGVQVFRFTATTAGPVRIVFTYRRPWAPAATDRTTEAHITAE